MRNRSRSAGTLYAVGHSTRSTRELLELLRAHGVEQVVDVRTIPRSRHNPQFNGPALARSLRAAGLRYRHLKALGGLRHARPDSVNLGWRNASFRGYADYMQSAAFAVELERLMALASQERVALMCAEAVPWRCHRSLIADALVARGIEVEHILSATTRKPHTYTPFARVEGEKITYPGLPLDDS